MLSGNRCRRGLTSWLPPKLGGQTEKSIAQLRLPRLAGGSRRLCRRRTVALSYLFRRRGPGARPSRRRRRAREEHRAVRAREQEHNLVDRYLQL
jgi:hypothetical protein